jgi:hypothetical protein
VTGRSGRRLASRRQSYSWLDWLCVVLPMMRWVRTYKLRQYLLVRRPAGRHAHAWRPSCTLAPAPRRAARPAAPSSFKQRAASYRVQRRRALTHLLSLAAVSP